MCKNSFIKIWCQYLLHSKITQQQLKYYNIRQMKINGVQIYSSPTSQPYAKNEAKLIQLEKQLKLINESYINIFNDETYKSDLLSRKSAASLYSNIRDFFQQSSTEERNQRKQRFCGIFREIIIGFVEGFVMGSLSHCQQDRELVRCLIQKWEQFKRFCHLQVFLLKAAETHYETCYKSYKSQAKPNKIESKQSIFPIPAVALHYFETIVYNSYKHQITRIIRAMLAEEREGKMIDREVLQSLFQIVYSNGLAELGRINVEKNNFYFFPTQNKEIEKQYSNANKNPDVSFFKNVLNIIIEDVEHYYTNLFQQTICKFGPHEDFQTVWKILLKEEETANNYFFNDNQKNAYLNKIKQIIVVSNLQNRLKRENSLKQFLQKFDPNQDEYLSEIKLYVGIIFKSKQQTLNIFINIIRQFLMESGAKINEKLNKRRQHMTEMINLKKSINRLIDELMHKDLSICVVRDKCFKKILDSIEASRNLADFVDFKVKQSIKNKLGEVEIIQKMKDVFLILQNLAATDSFLIYHQQLLGRRLLEPLNQPRIDIEKYLLKKIGEQLGSVTTNAHSYMIKDIQKSQQITENYSKRMPLARFKWTCRIISPQFWSDNINNNNLQMVLPEVLRIEADSIRQFYHAEFSRYLSWKIEKGFSLFEGNFTSGKFRFQSENIFLMLLFHICEGKGHQMHFWELLQKITKQKDGGVNYIMKCVKVLIQNGLILRSNPDPSSNFSETEILRVNLDFKPAQGLKPNQTIIIKVSPEMMRAMHETSVQNAKILKQRERVVEAVLVKLLKHSHSTGNNRTSLEQLIRGVREYNFLRNFDISEAVIKQKLEEIIGRGYCERNEKDRKIYHYIA